LANKRTKTAPLTILFLVMPYGINLGFISVTLPYILTHHGFAVSSAASITAVALFGNVWRFLWAPFTDLTLSLHKWYVIGLCFCASTICLLCIVPIDKTASGLLIAIVLISHIAATFVLSPVGGFMAKTVDQEKKGRAGGWYQAGNVGGTGIGGGAGLWLFTHYSLPISVATLSAAMLLFVIALYFVPHVPAPKEKTMKEEFKIIAADLKELFGSRVAVFTIVVILTPIGIGAASFLWSSVGFDWKANANTIALITGVLSGLVSVVGCIAGGWAVDKLGRWWAFFGAGTLMATITLVMSISPFIPIYYTGGVLTYAFANGCVNAAFSGVVLLAIGKGLASTKYALLSSLGNIPVVYMTAFDGWIHDRYNIKTMLLGETFLGLGFVALFLFLLSRFVIRKAVKPRMAYAEQPAVRQHEHDK
jgi:MFS transporter, PAT family, beta-lactamase induction signal transducer AmpG